VLINFEIPPALRTRNASGDRSKADPRNIDDQWKRIKEILRERNPKKTGRASWEVQPAFGAGGGWSLTGASVATTAPRAAHGAA